MTSLCGALTGERMRGPKTAIQKGINLNKEHRHQLQQFLQGLEREMEALVNSGPWKSGESPKQEWRRRPEQTVDTEQEGEGRTN